jgi:hypothetical protein
MSQSQPKPIRQPSRARASVQMMARAAMVQAHEAALLLSVAATAPVRLFRREDEPANTMSSRAKAHAALCFDCVGHLGMLLSREILAYITTALSAAGTASATEPVIDLLASAT